MSKMTNQTDIEVAVRRKELYSLYDKKTQTWSAPFVHTTKGDAIRSFTDAVNKENAQSLIYAHPEDFDLIRIGFFDETQGTLFPDKQHVGNGLDFKQEQVH
jgi:hypothetical protein